MALRRFTERPLSAQTAYGELGEQTRTFEVTDPELRIDFVTNAARGGKPVRVPNLNLSLQPLKFMELSLEDTTQASSSDATAPAL